jgi:putative DNA primase/helicase
VEGDERMKTASSSDSFETHRFEPGDLPNDIVTEDSAAQEFVDLHEQELRYDHTIKKWYRWTGQFWQRDDTALAFHWSRQLARHLAQKQDARARYITSKVSFAGSVEKFARSDPKVAVTRDYWDPDKYLLGTPGGTVDLRTGGLRPASPEDLITRQTAVAPADTADCPNFKQFLKQATNGDDELTSFLQQFCGYCLTGDTKEQALIFIHGDGGNGKGVLQRVLGNVMGSYTATATMDTFMASNFDKHSTDLASLADARLVMASETEEGRLWAEAKIKQMTGGDKIKARFMRQDNFTFMPEFKLFLIGNNQPNLKQVNNAIRRRFNIVPFIYKPAEVDFDLEELKLKPEWPGILRWFIDGCLKWQKTALKRPKVITEANEEYFGEQDLLQQWIDECCDLKASIWDTSKNLFASWSDWMTERGENPGSQKSLTQSLKKRPGISKKDAKTARGLEGIRVKAKTSYGQPPDFNNACRQSETGKENDYAD